MVYNSIPLPFQICMRTWIYSSMHILYIYIVYIYMSYIYICMYICKFFSHLTFPSFIYYSPTLGPTTPFLVQSDIGGPHDHQDDCRHHLGPVGQEQHLLGICLMWMVGSASWAVKNHQRQRHIGNFNFGNR